MDAISIGHCPACGYGIAFQDGTKTTTCPKCSTKLALKMVNGSLNTRMPCDDRCQYASRPFCSCSCSGANHSRGYINADKVPAWVRKRDADRAEAKKAAAEKRKTTARNGDAAKLAEQLAQHPELADLRGADYEGVGGFVSDMRRLLLVGKALTPAQLTRAVQMIRDDQARALVQKAWAEQRAAQQEPTCPTGEVSFTGHIVSASVAQNRWGIYFRALVKADAGWQVWTRLPITVLRQVPAADFDGHVDLDQTARMQAFAGRRIELTGTAEPTLPDATQGNLHWPAGRLIDAKAAALVAA